MERRRKGVCRLLFDWGRGRSNLPENVKLIEATYSFPTQNLRNAISSLSFGQQIPDRASLQTGPVSIHASNTGVFLNSSTFGSFCKEFYRSIYPRVCISHLVFNSSPSLAIMSKASRVLLGGKKSILNRMGCGAFELGELGKIGKVLFSELNIWRYGDQGDSIGNISYLIGRDGGERMNGLGDE